MGKKGITAIVATVLLLMMTVAAAGLAYVWIMDIQNIVKEDTEKNLMQNRDRLEAKLSIESIWNESGNISLALKNAGTYTFSDTSKFSVYINGAPLAASKVSYSPAGAFSPGGLTTVNIKESFVTPNNPKTIRITSEIGTDVSYRCTIPTLTQNYC